MRLFQHEVFLFGTFGYRKFENPPEQFVSTFIQYIEICVKEKYMIPFQMLFYFVTALRTLLENSYSLTARQRCTFMDFRLDSLP